MPRLSGVKERRHQPLFDTLVRTNAVSTVQQTTSLFGNANVGQPALTNMNAPGQLASDQTYIVLAMRAFLYFEHEADLVPNARALYVGVASQLYFTFILGEKPQFTCPAWYLPAGGGIWSGGAGAQSTAGLALPAIDPIYANGVPSQESILKLARPIMVPVRQSVSVQAQFNPINTDDVRVTLNALVASKCIQFFLDGLQTREVL
jgi:hypothetical protein